MFNTFSHKGNANQNYRFHFTPVTLAIIMKIDNKQINKGCGGEGTPIHCWWECKLVQHYVNQYGVCKNRLTL
jgi:hypothetical protein